MGTHPIFGSVPTSSKMGCVPISGAEMTRASSASSSARNSVMETGTPAARSIRKNRISMALRRGSARTTGAPVQEDELFEKVHVLLVLQERAVERWNRSLGVVGTQRLGRNVLGEQQLEPVEQFRGGGLLLEAGHVADPVEGAECLGQQLALEPGEMHADDTLHRLGIGEADVVEE